MPVSKNSSCHKPRILLLTPAFPPNLGGVEVHLEDLTHYLSSHHYPTTVLTYQPITTQARGAGVETTPNLEIHRYSWISGNYFNIFVNLHPVFNFLYLTPYLFLRTFLFLLTRHSQIDVIHAIGLSTAVSARIFKYIFHKPVVMSTETLFNFQPGSAFATVSRWVLSGMDTILAQSRQSKNELVQLGVPSSHIKIFDHWINQEVFTPTSKPTAKKLLNWPSKFTILYVGRLIPEKGVRLAIAAAQKLSDLVNLKIIGSEGPELEYVQKTAADSSNIEFLGKFSHYELAKYYQAADVLVYPALYKEDMAYVLLDSLSCGTPVINTNPGSGVYRLPPGVGFVILPKVDVIVSKLEVLLKSPKLLAGMSASAAEFSKKFGPRLAKKVTAVYDSLIAK